MSVSLCQKRGDISVKPYRLLQLCHTLLKSQVKNLHIRYRHTLNHLLSLTVFPLLRLSQDSGNVQQLSKPESAVETRYLAAVLLALLTLTSLFVLYLLRAYDDNRLTSWQWVFANKEVFVTGLIVLAGLLLSWWLSGIRLSQKKPLVILLTSSFMVCAALWSQPEVIVDASRYFLQAKYLAANGAAYFLNEWGYGIAAWTDLPLVPFLYGLVFKFVGEYRIAIQVLTTLFFCGTVFLTFLIGTELWDEMTGLYGGALLLGMPFLLTQVPLMLVDVPTMFFLSLAVYTTLKAVKTEALSWLVMAMISIVLALLSKYSTWLMLSVLPVVAISCRPGSWVELCKRMSYILIGVGLFFTLLLLWKYDFIVKQIALLVTYQLPGLNRWQESHVSTFLYQVHPFVTLAALFSIYLAWHKRDVRYLVIIWMLLLVFFLDIKRIRYALIVFPMLALMAAYALRQIGDSRIRNYLVLCIVVSSVTVTLYGYSPFLNATSASNIKQAGEYLNKINAPMVEVIVLPQSKSSINPMVSVPLLDLFTKKNLVYWEPPGLMSQPGQQQLSKSSLRFSWEYKVAKYYEARNKIDDKAIVIISDDAAQVLPAVVTERLNGFHIKQRFAQYEGVYRYSTIVEVYEANRLHEPFDNI